MPGDPEIDRDVKSGEEKLWEAVYDNKTDKVEHILSTYLTGRLSPPDGPGIDLNWKCTPRRGVFMPPDGRHNGWTAYLPDLRVVETPGDHDSMVLEPNVRSLATVLRGVIDAL